MSFLKNTLFIFIGCFSLVVFGQDSLTLHLKKEINVKDASLFSLDKKGNLFIADARSNIFKYDSSGKEIFHYSPGKPAFPKILDAFNTSRIFVLYEERQEYVFLDWLLSPIASESFDMDQFGYVSIAGQSANNMLWIVDNVHFTLSKYDTRTQSKLVETNLETLVKSELHPLWIKEIGNYLYISTEQNGILVFDNMGNYKKKLPFNNISFFDIRQDEIYWNDNGEITFFNLLNFSKKTESTGINGKLLIRDRVYYFLNHSRITSYTTP